MAKTFNPNRVGGGSVSIVRAADGTYSLKETGFDQISSLNMVDLGAIAATTTAAKTETATDKTGTSVEDQTKQAFLLPKQDRGDDPFTTEKMFKSATDVSKSLSDSITQSSIANQEAQEQAAGIGSTSTFNANTFDDAVGTRIKDPTGPVFGRTPLEDDFKTMVGPKVETPQDKLKLSAAEKEKRTPKFLSNVFSSIGEAIKGDKFKTEKGSEVNIDKGRGSPLGERYRSEVAQAGSGKRNINIAPNIFDINERGDPALNVGSQNVTGADPYKARTLGITPNVGSFGQDPTSRIGGTDLEADAGAVPRSDIQPVSKRTFAQSVNTALKGVGEAVQFMSPVMGIVQALGATKNESASTIAFNKNKFNIVTSSGPMQGRIVGDDGTYDPQNNLFHGMNRTSAFGNLEKAGQKRIDRIKENLAKGKYRNPEAQQAKVDKFERELDDYRRGKNDHNIKEYNKNKKNTPMNQLNPNEQRNVSETGNAEGNTSSKIVCTMMNQSYGFGSFRNKIWMKFHKDLAPEYQKGYHRLFLPLVKIAKTNKIIKNILEHIAVHSTIDMRQSMRGKKHLLGRVYRKILLPICYWAGKK